MVANKAYSGSPKPTLAALKFFPFTSDSTEYTALKTGQVDVGNIPTQDLPQKSPSSALPPTNPLGSSWTLQPFYNYGIQYAQPNFNNPQVGFMVRQLYMRQALQYVVDQPGLSKAIWRGYATPTSGPAPTTIPNPYAPPIQKSNAGQGPYPFSISKAKSLLTSHGWAMSGGVMTCQDPAKCGTGITKGQQAKFTFNYSTGVAAATAMWQAIKFVPFTSDSAEYTALKTGSVNVGNIPTQDLPPKPANSPVPATNPLGSSWTLQPFYSYGIQYAQPNFNNPTVGFMVRQLYIRQALQYIVDQPGISKAIWRGYATPTSGPAPTTIPNPYAPSIQHENGGVGPYPFSISKAKSLLTS
ncbi:MAG TPA: ABC transporter substrate-binding protein, partial [Gemmatimonadales bacterium]|nr:ABC transporter substrate-binding protein [Gemmatimonadales bacterium]